jgi:Tfp pilus assembly protein PilZ
MNRRRLPRTKMRIACTLHLEESLHSGMVLDVSAGGLFVQTNASPAPGTPLRLELRVPGLSEPIEMQATVARKRIVPPRLRALLKGGIGLQLENPPEEFYALVARLQAPELATSETSREAKPPEKTSQSSGKPAEKPPPAKPKLTSFRVRLSQTGGEGSRILVIRASDEDEASRRAILDVGDSWKVLSCEPK